MILVDLKYKNSTIHILSLKHEWCYIFYIIRKPINSFLLKDL
jgi:hypothetical protein